MQPASVSSFQYDRNGNNTATINRNTGAFGSAYYDDDRVWTRQTPTGRTTIQTYNRSGLAASVSEPSNQITTFGYDDRARINSKTDPVGTSSYTYDQNNNLLTHTENSRTITRRLRRIEPADQLQPMKAATLSAISTTTMGTSPA